MLYQHLVGDILRFTFLNRRSPPSKELIIVLFFPSGMTQRHSIVVILDLDFHISMSFLLWYVSAEPKKESLMDSWDHHTFLLMGCAYDLTPHIHPHRDYHGVRFAFFDTPFPSPH